MRKKTENKNLVGRMLQQFSKTKRGSLKIIKKLKTVPLVFKCNWQKQLKPDCNQCNDDHVSILDQYHILRSTSYEEITTTTENLSIESIHCPLSFYLLTITWHSYRNEYY